MKDTMRPTDYLTLERLDRESRGCPTLIKDYAVTGDFTPTRTLNAETADLTEIRNFLATLISDLKRVGLNRGHKWRPG